MLPSPLTAAVALALLLLALLAVLFLRRAPALSREWSRFPIVARRVVTTGERPVIFLTVAVSTAALPTGAHVKVRATLRGRVEIRSYTPTRFDGGLCELMFRVYENGPMSTHLGGLRVGDAVEMIGPTGIERYGARGPGTFSRGAQEWRGISHVALVSGGTGITPMLQIANHVLGDPRDATRLALVSFTTSADDVMLEDTLRGLAAASRGALALTFVASARKPARADVATGSMRELTPEGLAKLLGVPAGPTTMVCVCGPDGFCERAKELLAAGGFANVIVW